MSSTTGEQMHRGYVIRTMAVGKQVKARAFTGHKAVLDAQAPSLDAVLKTMRDRLDARDAAHREQRRDSVPTADEFVDAFNRVDAKASVPQRKMLRALHDAPERTLSGVQLASAAGYAREQTAREKFAQFAKLVAEDLAWQPEADADASAMWLTTLAVGVPAANGAPTWRLRPEVAEAIERVSLFPAVPPPPPFRPV